ncbi:MAG: hypothetical protein KA250_16335, partial [Verrucomicrobiales bacterium]|nr:hypothetical protein [Verrucomicrobiales bacterium]
MKVPFFRFLNILVLILLSRDSFAQEPVSKGRDIGSEVRNLAENPGFELESVSPDPGGRKWVLKSGDRVPDNWSLSPAFPGELEVMESAAPEGKRFLRVTAGKDRAAHLYQGNPKIVRGPVYEISLRYQGGPVELEMYEYDAERNFVGEPVFVKSPGSSNRSNSWQEITGYYMLPEGVVRTSLAIVVPPGSRTDLDDLRMTGFERSSEKLNVRDFGVSGSSFETLAETRANSPVVTVENAGDFEVGQEVVVSRCSPHFSDGLVWAESNEGTREGNFRDQVELRGYDGSGGTRASYILDCKGDSPPAFRWSDDLGQSWKESVAITGDWQKLNAGIEVRLPNLEFWKKPGLVSFTASDHLLSRIEKIEGRSLTLAHSVPLAKKGCLVQHSDSGALQR